MLGPPAIAGWPCPIDAEGGATTASGLTHTAPSITTTTPPSGNINSSYVWDIGAGLPVVLQEMVGTATNTYVYGATGLLYWVDGAGNPTNRLTDGLGCTVGLADAASNIAATWACDVFGVVRASTGSQANAFTFTGEQTDASTGLEYLRARYYEAGTGRFLAPDRFPGIVGLPLSLAPYAYVLNRPTSLIDPSGFCAFGLPCPKPLKEAEKAISKGIENAGKAAGAAVDAITTGYVDAGVTACVIYVVGCVTVGVQVGLGDGLHPYAGAGVGTPGISGAINLYPGQRISEGLNCGVSGGSPIYGPVGVGVEVGYGGIGVERDKEGGFAVTGGDYRGFGLYAGEPGVSATCYYVFPDLLGLF